MIMLFSTLTGTRSVLVSNASEWDLNGYYTLFYPKYKELIAVRREGVI
jgi:hypothetical protein